MSKIKHRGSRRESTAALYPRRSGLTPMTSSRSVIRCAGSRHRDHGWRRDADLAAWRDPDHWESDWAEVLNGESVDEYFSRLALFRRR